MQKNSNPICEQPTLKVLQAIFCSVRSHLCMQHRRGIFLFQSDNFVTGFSRSPHISHYCTLSTSPGKGTRNFSYHFWAEPHHPNSILGQRAVFRLSIPASGSSTGPNIVFQGNWERDDSFILFMILPKYEPWKSLVFFWIHEEKDFKWSKRDVTQCLADIRYVQNYSQHPLIAGQGSSEE